MIVLKEVNRNQLKKTKYLYKKAFPIAERKPFSRIAKQRNVNITEVLAITKDNKYKGLIITLLYKDIVLLDYFAILDKFRGEGLGTETLKVFKERYPNKRLILEIEIPEENAPNNMQRLSRKNFYLRNGLKETDISNINADGVKLQTLAFTEPITYDEYMEMCAVSLGKKVAKKFIRI